MYLFIHKYCMSIYISAAHMVLVDVYVWIFVSDMYTVLCVLGGGGMQVGVVYTMMQLGALPD